MINFDFLVETVIQGISTSRRGREYDVLISIQDHQMNNWILTAHTVTEFYLSNMWLYNIIDRINLLDEKNTNIEDLHETILLLLGGRYSNNEEKRWALVNEILQKIRLSEIILLEIEPVAGVYILLTAETISLQKSDV